MKKFYLLTLLCTCFSLSLFANGIEIDGIYYLLDNTNYTASVTYPGKLLYDGGISYSGDIVIPASVVYNEIEYTVTNISDGAFYCDYNITSVSIPYSITSIGSNVFSDCHALMNINVDVLNTEYCSDEGVLFNKNKTILYLHPESKLDNDSAYVVPTTVTRIESSAFSNCNSFNTITLPDDVDYIGAFAFYNCANLESVSLPQRLTSIENYLFYHCAKLTSIIIPNSVHSIGRNAFEGCTGLTNVSLSENATIISNNAFSGCTQIPAIIIPNVVTILGDYVFANCSSLISVKLSSTLKQIGDYAFTNCIGLTEIEIPSSVTSIGSDAFSGCSNITSVHISDMTSWCHIHFNDNSACNPLVVAHNLYLGEELVTELVIPEGITSIGFAQFHGASCINNIHFSQSIDQIKGYAFCGCSNLTSVSLPASVTNLGSPIFLHCSNLKSVCVAEDNPSYISLDGVVYNKDTTSLVLYPEGKITHSFSIHSKTTSITKNAFYNCSGLFGLTIPKNISSIGATAFYGCNKLDTVICKANTPPTLGSSVFFNISPTSVLLVPYESIDAYKAIAGYADYFAEIKGFSDVEDITDTAATLKWIPDTAVVQYDINVYTSDTLFAHYVVDGNGQIVSSQRFAPSIYHQKLDTTVSSTEYFVISLDGLSAGTDYNYTIDGRGEDPQSAPIYHEEGAFTTLNEGEEGFILPFADDPRKQATKLLRDGMLLIERNGRIYNLNGTEIQTQNK